MRKSWHYLALGWAGVPCAKGAAAASVAPFSVWIFQSLSSEARVTIAKIPLYLLLFTSKQRLTFDSWKVVCQDSLDHKMNLNLVW